MSWSRSYQAAPIVLGVLALGEVACADLLGVNEGKPRPAEYGGGGGAGGGGGGGGAGGGGAPESPEAPRVLFTDLTSGPQQAFVTLYGVRLFDAGGDLPDVTAGGVAVEVIAAYDGDFDAKDVARGLDVVVVRVGEDVPLGPAPIVARRGGVATEPAPFTVRAGAIRIADATGGSDQSADCAEAAPCASLGKLVSVLQPGDVAYVREGDYTGEPACGVDWEGTPYVCALPLSDPMAAGTAAEPLAIVGYPGERPRLGLTGSPAGGALVHVGFRANGAGHVVLSNLVFTDVGLGGVAEATASLRIVGCRFESYEVDGILLLDDVGRVTVLGATFAAGALPTYRGLQACLGPVVDADVGWSVFDGVPMPIVLEPAEAFDVRFHHNLLRQPRVGLDFTACPLWSTEPIGRTLFHDNVVEGADYALVLPQESTHGAEVLVFNNTFYDLENGGFRREDPALIPIPTGEAIHVRNNIVVPLGAPYLCFHNMGACTATDDVALVGSHNLVSDGAGPFPAALGVVMDPLLVDAPADVSLGPDSPGIDAGTQALAGGAEELPPSARFDYRGVPRVLGAAIDIGAYERVPE